MLPSDDVFTSDEASFAKKEHKEIIRYKKIAKQLRAVMQLLVRGEKKERQNRLSSCVLFGISMTMDNLSKEQFVELGKLSSQLCD